MFITGVIIFTSLIIYTISTSSTLEVYFDVTSIIFVFISYIGLIFITNSGKNIAYGLLILIIKDENIDCKKLKDSIEIFTLLKRSSLWIGLLGVIIGVINLLSNLDDPATIGPALAISLLTIFYSLIISLVILIPIEFMLKKIERKIL